MATVKTRGDSYTFDDFCVLVNGKQKGDLIDGVIYVASPENIGANELFRWLFTVAGVFVRKK
ncbi:MAG: hypothetical protein JNM56_09680 [Planctomycetia bacterium]|nr:hypothetical protein [Planctomycetia bacterium]